MEQSREQLAAAVYQAFQNSGFSPAQARALTAEINRENSLRPKYLFGAHIDPANRATNVGMLSWQGSRADEVAKYLRRRGVMDKEGNITPGFDAIQAQTDFIRREMETNPAYKRTRETFLAQADIDPETAAVVLGDNYIRWRRTDPEYSASGYQRIAEGYDLLGAVNQATPEARRVQYGLGDRGPGTRAQVIDAVARGDMTKSEAGKYVSEELLEGVEGGSAYDILQDEKKEKERGMAMLGLGLEMLALEEQAPAPELMSLPLRLSRRRAPATPGTQAIGRFGLECLLRGNPLLGIR